MNLSESIKPKSDQLNADDLITGAMTIKIRDIKGTADPQQPVSIYFDGDDNKPYKPCKSMRRLMVSVWGVDGKKYIGRSMTLYRDDSVMFGGIKVGGIRISHVSDIESSVEVMLTASKTKRVGYTVKPLKVTAAPVKKELTPQHAKWEVAKKAIKEGAVSLESIKKVYGLSAENEKLLTS
jgi:hypothetical protein